MEQFENEKGGRKRVRSDDATFEMSFRSMEEFEIWKGLAEKKQEIKFCVQNTKLYTPKTSKIGLCIKRIVFHCSRGGRIIKKEGSTRSSKKDVQCPVYLTVSILQGTPAVKASYVGSHTHPVKIDDVKQLMKDIYDSTNSVLKQLETNVMQLRQRVGRFEMKPSVHEYENLTRMNEILGNFLQHDVLPESISYSTLKHQAAVRKKEAGRARPKVPKDPAAKKKPKTKKIMTA